MFWNKFENVLEQCSGNANLAVRKREWRMGVRDLTKHLACYRQDVKDWFKWAKGSTVGVDLMVWFHQFLPSCHYDLNRDVPRFDGVVRLVRRRLQRMVDAGIRVLVVLDGDSTPAKAATSAARRTASGKRLESLERRIQHTNNDKLRCALQYQASKERARITPELVDAVLQMLCQIKQTTRGVDYIRAPNEADHQLVHLAQNKVIDFVLSVDQDYLLHLGVKMLILKKPETGSGFYYGGARFYSLEKRQHEPDAKALDLGHVITKAAVKCRGSSAASPALTSRDTHIAAAICLAYALIVGTDYSDQLLEKTGPARAFPILNRLVSDAPAGCPCTYFYDPEHLCEAVRRTRGGNLMRSSAQSDLAKAVLAVRHGIIYSSISKRVEPMAPVPQNAPVDILGSLESDPTRAALLVTGARCRRENCTVCSTPTGRHLDNEAPPALGAREPIDPELFISNDDVDMLIAEETEMKSEMQGGIKRPRDTSSPRDTSRQQSSTSRDPDCVPFWTPFTGEMSKRLWSCTRTDLRASALTYWSTYSARKESNSWFTVKATTPSSLPSNSPRTLWRSQPSLWQAITANEQRKADADESAKEKKKRKLERSKAKKIYNLPRTRKLRVYPNQTERDTLKQWFGVVRRAYNTAVVVHKAAEKKEGEVYERVKACAFEVKRDKEGRPRIKAKKGKIYHLTIGWAGAKKQIAREMEREGKEEWVLKVPQAIRDSGIRDMEKAVSSGEARNKERSASGEESVKEQFTFRTRKDKSQTFEINARDWKATTKQGKLFACMRTSKEGIPETASCAIRVSMDKLGRVFLSFVKEVECKSETQAPTDGFHSTVALDPGVRTFQTMYDADGHGIEWGEGDMKQIFVLCRQADQIQSKISKKRATWTLRRAYHRKLRKIKDKIKECHNKLALFLCENYRVVLIPKFQVSRMVKKRNRKIRSKTVRQMCCWSHFAFREALKSKAALFPWCTIVEVGEAYTSKTCEECGTLHHKLGRNKVFRCPKCNHTCDRDLHAAKNILLRYITRENLLSEGWD